MSKLRDYKDIIALVSKSQEAAKTLMQELTDTIQTVENRIDPNNKDEQNDLNELKKQLNVLKHNDNELFKSKNLLDTYSQFFIDKTPATFFDKAKYVAGGIPGSVAHPIKFTTTVMESAKLKSDKSKEFKDVLEKCKALRNELDQSVENARTKNEEISGKYIRSRSGHRL